MTARSMLSSIGIIGSQMAMICGFWWASVEACSSRQEKISTQETAPDRLSLAR